LPGGGGQRLVVARQRKVFIAARVTRTAGDPLAASPIIHFSSAHHSASWRTASRGLIAIARPWRALGKANGAPLMLHAAGHQQVRVARADAWLPT
jgi:hypothetical protein